MEARGIGEVADELVLRLGETDVGDRPVGVGRAFAVERGEVAGVLLDREVRIHAGRLGQVAHLVAQRLGAGRVAEHGDGAAHDLLHADDRAHQGGLAAAARPEQAGDAAPRDGAAEVVQHATLAARHHEVFDLDRVVHRLLPNSTTDELNDR